MRAPNSMPPPTPPEPPAKTSRSAADTLEQKRAALEDVLKTYRDAKDAQAPEAPPSDQLNTAESAWQDALQGLQRG